MKIEYEYTFGIPRNLVWKYIKDENVLRNSLPGCKSFVESSNGVYVAEIEIHLGPIKDLLTLEVRREKEKSPTFYQLAMKGKGKLGEVEGVAELFIEDLHGTSKLTFSGDVQVTGKIAMVGKRILESGANKSLGKFFETVESEIKKIIHQVKRSGR
ncbi:SRPBCC domain-containing protein [Neobacillus pocheonensis]|uniref:SRPBCC domain-containing protein n=1 Tax=Neobacillus pocheonensis TaxID=363869 RepID=A0ABT0W9F1_9BACI|nr:SRPBCC domain-containing protein [Neobacillus pocheonensis]